MENTIKDFIMKNLKVLIIIFFVSISLGFFIHKIDDSAILEKEIPKKETFTIEESFAVDYWNDIIDINVSQESSTQEKIIAKEKIELIIDNLAASIKTGKRNYTDISIDGKDIRKAVMLLNKMSPMVIDEMFGDGDGFCSSSELYWFVNAPETSFQVGIVRKMVMTYYSLF